MNQLRLLCALCLLLCGVLPAFAKEVIKVYTYHLKPPLVVREATKEGLYYDELNYFNKHSTEYQFELHYLPRRRLDLLVNSNSLDGLVIGVSPIWFGDKQETKYLWTTSLLNDVDEVISSGTHPFEFTTLESLNGMRVGLVRGYYYFGVSEMAQKGQLIRDDASSEDHNFKKLLADRINVAIISRSNHDFVMKHNPDFVGKFHISKKPHDQYERRIMLPLKYVKVQHVLNQILARQHRDPAWKDVMAKYR
jgi:polar amino acid transport system substrate-binding protein